MRRAVALAALVVVVLIIAIGINSCEASSRKSALQSYTNNVSSLIAQSNQTSSRLFTELSQAGSAGDPTSVQAQINQTLHSATATLGQARALSVPSQVKTGNQLLLYALRMRADGISGIADDIQPALRSSGATTAINGIAVQMARFYSSDVLYKLYAGPQIAGALNAAGVRFGALNSGQFLPSVQWVLPTFVAGELHVHVAGAKIAPGTHGHLLNSVSVAGTTLQTGSTNTIPIKPTPTFTLNFTNSGKNTETNVVCKVTISGTSVSGKSTVSQTTAGQTTTCQVKLNAAPPPGAQHVVATIEPVPGEKVVDNNTLTFPVAFQ